MDQHHHRMTWPPFYRIFRIFELHTVSLKRMQRCEFATAVAIRNYGNKLELFDMDFNATHADLKTHLKSIVQDSSRLNVGQMLVPGCSLKDSLEAVQLAKSFPNVLFTTAGVHPYNVLERACDDIAKKELRELVNSENGTLVVLKCF